MRARHCPTLLVLAALLAGCGDEPVTLQPDGPRPAEPQAGDVIRGAQVVRVIDGDTLHATAPASKQLLKVRLVGIDTPETTELRSGSAECGGQEATQALRALVAEHPTVDLRTDRRQGARDQYARLLAYVEPAGGGVSFQEEQLRAGWAQVYESRDGIEREAAFRRAAEAARSAGRGVWARCGGDFRRPLGR